jgi:hypothetical protein
MAVYSPGLKHVPDFDNHSIPPQRMAGITAEFMDNASVVSEMDDSTEKRDQKALNQL